MSIIKIFNQSVVFAFPVKLDRQLGQHNPGASRQAIHKNRLNRPLCGHNIVRKHDFCSILLMENSDIGSRINACEYLYLRELSEPKELSLRVVIDEAKVEAAPTSINIGGIVLSDVRAIKANPANFSFELVWPTYILYSVRNESFAYPDKAEKWEGRLFCTYSKSHFLEYAKSGTIATDEYPEPFQHLGINCLNHVIDVISHKQAILKILSP